MPTKKMPSKDPIKAISESKVPVFMMTGAAYSVNEIEFTKEHPYQLMEWADAERLVDDLPYRFRFSSPEEIKRFYGEEK